MKTTATALRQDLFNIIDTTIKYNEVVSITTKSGNAVLISEEEYNGLLATAEITQNKSLYEKVLYGMQEPLELCVAEKEVKW